MRTLKRHVVRGIWVRAIAGISVAVGNAAALAGVPVTLRLDDSVKHQTIEGWGTHIGATDAATRAAYRDLGLNIIRMDLPKEVLSVSSTDLATRVPLSGDVEANIAKFNFDLQGLKDTAATAQWLSANAWEPSRVKLIGDVWSPPHWMKGPTGVSQQFVGNPSSDSPSFPTPWLSNTYNHWYNGPGGTHYINQAGSSIGGRVRTEDATNLAEYGEYFAAYVKGFERRYGLTFANISLQNESGFENPFDSSTMLVGPQKPDGTYPYDPAQYARCLKAVRDAFARDGVTTKIRGPHYANLQQDPLNPWGLLHQMNMIEAVRHDPDPTLKDAMAIYTSNYYQGVDEGSVKNVAAYWKGTANVPGPWVNWAPMAPGIGADGKENWFVENGDVGGTQWYDPTTHQGALVVALKMHDALVHADASAYLYWSFVDSDGSGNVTEHGLLGSNNLNNPISSKKYAAFKQFSAEVRPGAQRIDALFTGGVSSIGGASDYDTLHGLDASAYLNPLDQTMTVVMINMMATEQEVNIVLPSDINVADFGEYRTSATENYVWLGGIHVNGNTATVTVPAYSIVSLLGRTYTTVPEPGGLAFLIAGGVLLGNRRWFRRAPSL